jgi:hypothetical protein
VWIVSKALVEIDAISSVIAQARRIFQGRLQSCIENILYITGMICNEKFNIQFSHIISGCRAPVPPQIQGWPAATPASAPPDHNPSVDTAASVVGALAYFD